MFGYRDPLRSSRIVGGNGMATLGKGIIYCIGGVFFLGAIGSGGFGFIIVAIIVLLLMKGKK